MNVKKNDTVIVLSGKDKGKKGKVLEAMPAAGKVVVEGVNVATCHVKPKKQGDQGGIINREIPMYASKVMLVCPKCGKATRHAVKLADLEAARRLGVGVRTAAVLETAEPAVAAGVTDPGEGALRPPRWQPTP